MTNPRSAFVFLLILSACASGTVGGSTQETDQADGVGPNWDFPIDGGREVADPAYAGLPFTPVSPKGLGSPLRILVTPGDVGVRSAEIVWVYDQPGGSRMLLIEHLADAGPTQAEFEDLAAQPTGCQTQAPSSNDAVNFGEGAGPKIDCFGGRLYFTELTPGNQAFVNSGNVTTAVHWFAPLGATEEKALADVFRDPEIEVVIMGPSDQLSEDEALTAARSV
jgi:hypothetical protein